MSLSCTEKPRHLLIILKTVYSIWHPQSTVLFDNSVKCIYLSAVKRVGASVITVCRYCYNMISVTYPSSLYQQK